MEELESAALSVGMGNRGPDVLYPHRMFAAPGLQPVDPPAFTCPCPCALGSWLLRSPPTGAMHPSLFPLLRHLSCSWLLVNFRRRHRLCHVLWGFIMRLLKTLWDSEVITASLNLVSLLNSQVAVSSSMTLPVSEAERAELAPGSLLDALHQDFMGFTTQSLTLFPRTSTSFPP